MGNWEHFHHGADIGVRGTGASLAEAFEQAAMALTAVMTDPAAVKPVRPIEVRCAAPDAELLFADWLNILIYQTAVEQMLFSRFRVTLTQRPAATEGDTWSLEGMAWGEPIDRQKHHPAVEIKGATYTELRVAQTAEGQWLAQCVVDV
ncbi:MAG: archease [Pseudomonadota bacterium]